MMKRSLSVFEPITIPMYSDFEDAGMIGAVSRLLARLRKLVDTLALPAWLWSMDFLQAAAACASCVDVPAIIDTLVKTTCMLSIGSGGSKIQPRALSNVLTVVQMAATARLHFGEMLEALAASAASALVPAEEVSGMDVDQSALAFLYYDSYCAAVWTSAHAEFLATVEDLLCGRDATENLVRDLMVPPPDLYSVVNMSNLTHIGLANERSTSPRSCAKTSQPLLAILSRVTNAGSRGWQAMLLAASAESEGAVRICTQCVAVALTGMNPVLHPAVRRPWRERFVALRALRAQTYQDFKEIVHKAPIAVKEAVRLHLAAVYVLDCASLGAMQYACQPVGKLCIPPLGMPHPSFAAAMHRMADAGAHMLELRESAAASIHRHLVSEPRSRKKSDSRYSNRRPKYARKALSYSSSWLSGRSGPLGVATRSSAQVVSGLMSASYRSIYIPFWMHGKHHGHRASRLDSAQYSALHSLSAAHRMCTLLSDEDFQLAERLALGAPNASLMTVSQACTLLDIRPCADEPPGVPCSALSRVVQEAEMDVMKLCARDAALLIAFARIATVRSTMLSYDLGETTRRTQALAVCQRLMLPLASGEDPCTAAQTRLPKHATVLYFCSECRRVVNSVQDNSGKNQPFNELGLAASMLTIDGELYDGHMRCARRSSAALRTAVTLEAAAESLELEGLDPVVSPLFPIDLRPATIVSTMCKSSKRKVGETSTSETLTAAALHDSSSEVAKFRRDLKSCFEQESATTSCGDVPLVCVPILGRTIRVFGNWYALCGMCGALTRVSPASRFQGDICCMRCDFAMLAGKKAAAQMQAALPRPPPPVCRFCGKVEPENCSGIKWRSVAAPADTGGRNASVPPPLRVCWCCLKHRTIQPLNRNLTIDSL